jgi:hypothetical protein
MIYYNNKNLQVLLNNSNRKAAQTSLAFLNLWSPDTPSEKRSSTRCVSTIVSYSTLAALGYEIMKYQF